MKGRRNKESCDVCGRPEVFAIVEIERAKMMVCRSCAYGKKILYYLNEEEEGERGEIRAPVKKSEETEEIVDDYAKIIKKARESLGLPLPVLAEKIKESRGYMEKIERGELKPTLATARKLENELGIKLIEKTAEVAPSISHKKQSSEPTLGDLLEKGED